MEVMRTPAVLMRIPTEQRYVTQQFVSYQSVSVHQMELWLLE